MKKLIEQICREANVTPDQAKTMLLLVKKHVCKQYPMFTPMIKKAFGGLDEKVESFKKNLDNEQSKDSNISIDDYLD